MKPEHQKYVLENINKKSIKSIAEELHLKERKIRKFLEKEKIKRKKTDSQPLPYKPVKKTTLLLSLIFIIVLGFVAYGNSLDNKFVWDDEILIVNNDYIKNLHNIPGFFTKNITYATTDKSNFYRPLQMLTYAFDYTVSKLDVRTYHFTNIIMHILVAGLLYWLAQLLFQNSLLSLVSGLLFVSHPIHTEAVTYISGRADPLAALFVLLTAIFYIKYANKANTVFFYLLSIVSYVLALMCKEVTLIAPLVLIIYDSVYKFAGKISLKRYLPFLLILFVYIFLRKTVLNFPVKNIIVMQTTFVQRIPVIFQSLALYLQKLIFPAKLHMEYELIIPPLTDVRVILGMVTALALLLMAILCRKKEKAVSFSVTWFLINYLPISNIYPLNAFFAEHWIYIPSIGLFILAGWVIGKMLEKGRILKYLVYLLLAFLLACSLYLTRKQNLYWKDSEHFYKATLKYSPGSSRMHGGLAFIYFQKGMMDEGIAEAEKSLELDPNFVTAYENLGNAYLIKGLYDKAIETCEKAIKINPEAVVAHQNLGAVYFKKGIFDKALAEFEKILSLNPNYKDIYNSIGSTYAMMGKYEEAIPAFQKAMERDPNNVSLYSNLAQVYYYDKKYDLAIKYCDQARKLGYDVDPEFLKLLEPYRKQEAK
jgi:tetratricopeptide (TPR) repeat protein